MRVDRRARCTSLDTQWHLEQEIAAKNPENRKERQTINSTNLIGEEEAELGLGDFNSNQRECG